MAIEIVDDYPLKAWWCSIVFSKRLPEGNSQSPLRSGWFMDEICVVHFPIMIDTRQRVLIMGFHREHDKKCYRNVLSKDNIRIYSCIQCIYILYTYIYIHVDTQNESNYVMCFVHIMRIPPLHGKLMKGNMRIHHGNLPYFSEPIKR